MKLPEVCVCGCVCVFIIFIGSENRRPLRSNSSKWLFEAAIM